MTVVVVGAGIAGACTAFELAERGIDVLLLDRGEVSGGTTALGEGNVLRSDKAPGPELGLAIAGHAVWEEMEERFAAAARVQHKGALVLEARPEHAAGLRAAGVPAEHVAADRLRELEPALARDVDGAVLVPDELQVDPRGLARALAERVPVRTGAEVAAIEPGGVLLAGGERIAADHVVLAAGPWSAPLAATAGLDLPVQPRKGQLVALAAPGLVRRKLFEASYLDAVGGDEPDLAIASVIECTLDGDEVLVGSSRERRGFDSEPRPEVTAALLERAARFVPALRELRPRRAWSGFRPFLPDHLPAIGPSRLVPGLHVCTGHEGAGVGLGPVSGRIVAQLIAGESPVVDPQPFYPDRF